MLNKNQQELVERIDCSKCSQRIVCDQIRRECSMINLSTLQVDDIAILKPIPGKESEQNVSDPGFSETTKKDFETHLYGNITRCRNKDKILSFFSSEKEACGLLLFFFSHQGRYYKAFRDKSLTNAALDSQIMSILYPDSRSFMYLGWLCKFDIKDQLFHLYTPDEREQPSSMRICEMEVSTPMQAMEFINCY